MKADGGGRKEDGRGRRGDPGKSADRFAFSISLSKLGAFVLIAL